MDTQRFSLTRSLGTAAAFALLIGAVGCGSDSTTAPIDIVEEQDQVPPISPTGVQVAKVDDGSFSMKWDANSEADLAGYRVYVYHPTALQSETYELVSGDDLVAKPRFVYHAQGSETVVWTRVTAVDVHQNESPLSSRVEVSLVGSQNEILDEDPNGNDRPGIGPTPGLPLPSPGPGHNDSEQK